MRHNYKDGEWTVTGIPGWVRGLLIAVLVLGLTVVMTIAVITMLNAIFDLGRMAGCN